METEHTSDSNDADRQPYVKPRLERHPDWDLVTGEPPPSV